MGKLLKGNILKLIINDIREQWGMNFIPQDIGHQILIVYNQKKFVAGNICNRVQPFPYNFLRFKFPSRYFRF